MTEYSLKSLVYAGPIQDNTHAILALVGGKWAPCPDCNDKGTIEDEYGGHDCISCMSRLLPIPTTNNGTTLIDWGDEVVLWADGTIEAIIYEVLNEKGKTMPKAELTDIAAEIHGETGKAWRLYDGTVTEWVTKSQVENNGDGTFTMPVWIAKDKGFI